MLVFSGISSAVIAFAGLPCLADAAPIFIAALIANFAAMVLSLSFTSARHVQLPFPVIASGRRRYYAHGDRVELSWRMKVLYATAWTMVCLAVVLWLVGLYVACVPRRDRS